MQRNFDHVFIEAIKHSEFVFTKEGFPAQFVTLLKDTSIPARLVMNVATERKWNEYTGWRMVNYYTNGKFFETGQSEMDLVVICDFPPAGIKESDLDDMPSWTYEEYDVRSKEVWLGRDHKDYAAIAKRASPEYKKMLEGLGLQGGMEDHLKWLDNDKSTINIM